MRFTRYVYDNTPHLLPADGPEPAGDWQQIVRTAGFDPADEELAWATLSAPWNGHPAGSIVVTELTVEGHRFAVEDRSPGPEKRLPSKAVSALLRLERAGDEHSRTTQRLCDAAWLVADLLRRQWVEHVSARAGRHDDVTAYIRTGISVDARGVTLWSGADDGEVIAADGNPKLPSRWAAIRLAEAVADGWLTDLTQWLEARSSENAVATKGLEEAATKLDTAVLDATADRLAGD